MKISVAAYSDRHAFCIAGISYIGKPVHHTAMFITNKVANLLEHLYAVDACLIFAESGMPVSEALLEKHCFVFSATPQYEYTLFVQKIEKEREAQNRLRKYTLTDGGYYIGENVHIGKNAHIEPLCLIGHDVSIGDNAYLMTGSKMQHASIGDNFIAGENSVVGNLGFTMVDTPDGNKARLPALGKVMIGNHVELGALSSIAVGTAGDTVLKNNVKIDTHVHVGHDNVIDENVELTSGTVLGGYNDIGKNAFLGLNTTTKNRLTIAPNTIVGMGAVVLKSIEESAVVVGNPARILQKEVQRCNSEI